MFILIEKYMLRTKLERQSHLDLSDLCICIGGNSIQCRLLLAHHLKTTVPKGMKTHLCHACNNGACSNPKHLYWGTARENQEDNALLIPAIAKAMQKRKGLPLTEEHKEKIRLARLGQINNPAGKNSGS
jgi:hypothetical protein